MQDKREGDAVIYLVAGSEHETASVAARLAPLLAPGDVIFLRGALGVGKTTFARALVHALGSPAPVSSPTFTLIHEYAGGRVPVVHADAYRLSGPDDAYGIGLTEYLERGDSVTVIEWPERIADALPGDRLDIAFAEEGDVSRRMTLAAIGARWEPALAVLSRDRAAC